MSIFDLDTPPEHIDRVNNETRNLFSQLRTEKMKILEIFRGLQGPLSEEHKKWYFDNTIDISLAWEEFDKLAYQAIFQETKGDLEFLYDPYVRNRILSRIFNVWPIVYYVKQLEKSGIMEAIDLDGGQVYFFKPDYKQSINTLSTASSILHGS